MDSCSFPNDSCFSGSLDCNRVNSGCPSSDFIDLDLNYGNCYSFESDNKLSWNDANTVCMAKGKEEQSEGTVN